MALLSVGISTFDGKIIDIGDEEKRSTELVRWYVGISAFKTLTLHALFIFLGDGLKPTISELAKAMNLKFRSVVFRYLEFGMICQISGRPPV